MSARDGSELGKSWSRIRIKFIRILSSAVQILYPVVLSIHKKKILLKNIKLFINKKMLKRKISKIIFLSKTFFKRVKKADTQNQPRPDIRSDIPLHPVTFFRQLVYTVPVF